MRKLDAAAVRQIAARAREQYSAAGKPMLSVLRQAEVDPPVVVHAPDGQPAYWLVPYVIGDFAAGFARIGLAGAVSQIGTFGAGPDDRRSWIPRDFFQRPNDRALDEIRAQFADAVISEPMLSYDTSPAKWGWRLTVSRQGRVAAVVFITPGGWYERPQGPNPPDTEG